MCLIPFTIHDEFSYLLSEFDISKFSHKANFYETNFIIEIYYVS